MMWIAGRRTEPLVVVGLSACLAALLAFDVEGAGQIGAGNPTAIIIPVALLAGWALRPRWAAPVWAFAVAVAIVAAVTGAVPTVDAATIALGAMGAGVCGYAAGAAYRASLGAVDRQVELIGRMSALMSGRTGLTATLESALHATAEVLGRGVGGGSVDAAILELTDSQPRLLSAVGADPFGDLDMLAEASRSGPSPSASAGGRIGHVRIDVDGRPWGILAIRLPPHLRFRRRELALIRAIAELAGAVVDSRLRTAEQERLRHRLEVTVEALRDVGFETELDQVTMRLLARAAQMVGADRGSIGRIEGDQLIVEADWPDADRSRTARTLSLAGVPGLLDTLRSGAHFQHSAPEVDGASARHRLQHPLMAGGELVGLMALSRAAGGPFGDAELQELQQLTSLTALTLRSARLLVQARSLGVAKSEFLNMAAHELRTPLAVVRGYLSMMEDGTLEVPETTRTRVITVLCQKADELSAMIDQILMAAQIQAGRFQIARAVFDLREAIGETIARLRSRAEQMGVELWCQALPEPIPVDAVRTSVIRILDNVIGNAITYGNRLPVRLTVEVGETVLVRIEDQGLGMSPEQQARLFEPFFRVDQPEVGGQAGAGLGLAVSSRLAEFSGGSLDLEWSQLGVGSTFVLRLPPASSHSSSGRAWVPTD